VCARCDISANSPLDSCECWRAGDLLLINTRLWFHSTQIPSTANPAPCAPAGGGNQGSLPLSVSVARDFYIGQDAKSRAAAHEAGMMGGGGESGAGCGGDVDMTNVDASWALADIGE